MVSDKNILASNALINDATAPRTAVFVGGTSGIGKLTVRALVATGASVRIYLIGRKNSEERTRAFIKELAVINAKAEVIWTEGEISLLAETKRVCEFIKAKESRVDLLFLTVGYAPFTTTRRETAEGIETTQSLGYYSRILFIQHLLPLLAQAGAPKVVSVYGGGREWASVDLDDLDLRRPGNFGLKSHTQFMSMNTTTMEKLAGDNPSIAFIHSCPGSVYTGNVWRGVVDPGSLMGWCVRLFLEPFLWLLSIRDDVSAQRHLFQCTSAAFGGRGVPWTGKAGINTLGKRANGLFLVNWKCDCSSNASVLRSLREKAQGKIWVHTQDVLGPYL